MLGQVAQQRERLRAQGAFDIAVPQPALDPIEAKVTEGYETSSGHDRLVVGVASRLQVARRHPPGRRTVGSKDTAVMVLPSEPGMHCRCDRYPPMVPAGTSQGPSGVLPWLRSQTWMNPSAERKSGSRSASAKPIFRRSATRSGRSPTCARPSPLKSKTFCPVTCRSNLPKPGISNGYVTLFPVRRCVSRSVKSPPSKPSPHASLPKRGPTCPATPLKSLPNATGPFILSTAYL